MSQELRTKIDLNDVYDSLRCLADGLKDSVFNCLAVCDNKPFCEEVFKLLQKFNCEKGERYSREERR